MGRISRSAALSMMGLAEIRYRIRRSHARMVAVFFAVLFALVSMVAGGMLVLAPVSGGYVTEILWGNALGLEPWNYPGLLVVAPWGVLALPFLATVTMILVSTGVGLGTTTALLMVYPVLRRRSGKANARLAATTAGIGSSPAITGLATLGACCCSSCATGGIAVVAAASGTSLSTLLRNDWYLDLFQLIVVYVALLAQERGLRRAQETCEVAPKRLGRMTLGLLLRLGLLVAGITWSLTMFVEWGFTNPSTGSVALWYHWIFEHQFLAMTAVAAGMFPRELAAMARTLLRRTAGVLWRIGLIVSGITWGLWVPPAMVRVGLGGLLNEIMGYLGAPAAFGAIPPDSPLGAPLAFHWLFQHLLLASFGLALGLAPRRATAALLGSIDDADTASSSRGVPERFPPPERSHLPADTAASARPSRVASNLLTRVKEENPPTLEGGIRS